MPLLILCRCFPSLLGTPASSVSWIPRKKKIQRTWKWMELRKKCLLSFCPGPETTAAAVGPSYEISWAIGSSNIILNYSRDFEKELERSVRCKRMEFLFAIGPQRSTKRKFSSFYASFFFAQQMRQRIQGSCIFSNSADAGADSKLMHFFLEQRMLFVYVQNLNFWFWIFVCNKNSNIIEEYNESDRWRCEVDAYFIS